MEKTKECPHCKYNCPSNLIKKHLEFCDKNPKGKKYRPKPGLFDKFFLSPIATLILIVSIILSIILKGGLWFIISFISLVWIIFRSREYEENKS